MIRLIPCLLVCLCISAFCGGFGHLTKEEKVMDFYQLRRLLEENYGMLDFKKQEIIKDDYLAFTKKYFIDVSKTTNDLDFYMLLKKYIYDFKDAHLNVIDIFVNKSAFLPTWFKYVDGKVLLSKVENYGSLEITARPGAELLEFDGIAVSDYLAGLAVQISCGGTETAILGSAVAYLDWRRDGVAWPEAESAVLKFKSYPTGEIIFNTATWEKKTIDELYRSRKTRFFRSDITDWGERRPDRCQVPHALFMMQKELYKGGTDRTLLQKECSRALYNGLTLEVGGLTIGYIIVPTYGDKFDPDGYAATLTAMSGCHGLIIDQRDNGGGYVTYCYKLASWLTDKELTNSDYSVRINRAYMSEMQGYMLSSHAAAVKPYYDIVLKNYQEGKKNSDYMPAFMEPKISPDPDIKFLKPVVIMINSQCYSGGDIFPAVIQDNDFSGRVKLFGETTAGAGGNVNEYGPVSNCEIKLTVTESIIRRTNGKFIENFGTEPDIESPYTQEDLVSESNGVDSYVGKALVELLKMISPL
ncbi:MAG: S41 family peptidase [Candidatus Wallbacteria bacterium]|nr:S41 family peptidase [Candidatus Wallbacteria bacterium]